MGVVCCVGIAWSLALAVLLGVVIAWIANTDQLHSRLRKLGLTRQTSFSSEWYGALSQSRGYLVLHLTGERRLYGWAVEWPNTPEHGNFVMAPGGVGETGEVVQCLGRGWRHGATVWQFDTGDHVAGGHEPVSFTRQRLFSHAS